MDDIPGAVALLRDPLHKILTTSVLSADDRTRLEDIDTQAAQLTDSYQAGAIPWLEFAGQIKALLAQSHTIIGKYAQP